MSSRSAAESVGARDKSVLHIRAPPAQPRQGLTRLATPALRTHVVPLKQASAQRRPRHLARCLEFDLSFRGQRLAHSEECVCDRTLVLPHGNDAIAKATAWIAYVVCTSFHQQTFRSSDACGSGRRCGSHCAQAQQPPAQLFAEA